MVRNICLWAAWPSGRTRPLEYHTAQLEQDILEATALDMHKPSFEVKLSEISICRRELNHMLNNLGAWMKDENEDKNWAMQLDSAFICKDPYGVVLIIGPWNYPIYLLLVPLIGGGDGNCVVLKPSEISRNMERLVAEALLSYLNKVGKQPLSGQDCDDGCCQAPDTGDAGAGGQEPLLHIRHL
uniref:Aldehyde dehydrogenase domain-containing protein n=1 Tax=Gallus gallus TaxID=9031 RepID=A0A8V0ZJ45_CHICK